MNMFDEARTIRGMTEMCNMTQAEVARKLGVSQSYVGNKLRLLNFSERIQRLIEDNNLSERHARALLRLKDDDVICECIAKVRERGLTVMECEAMVDMLMLPKRPKLIGLAPRREGVERFMDVLNASLESLGALGISTKKSVSFHNNKRYITISIDEI